MKDIDIIVDELIDALKHKDNKKMSKINKELNNRMFDNIKYIVWLVNGLNNDQLHNLLDYTMIALMTNGYDCNKLENETSLMCKVFKLKKKGKI